MSSGPLDPAELARVLRLYAGPGHPRPVRHARAGGRLVAAGLAAGGAVAVVVVVAVVALLGAGRADNHAALTPTQCAPTVVSAGTTYRERAVGGLTLGRPLRKAMLRPCGAEPAPVTVTTIAGIPPQTALGIAGRPGRVYVIERCARVPDAKLIACLHARA
jgi:hypothetical protein